MKATANRTEVDTIRLALGRKTRRLVAAAGLLAVGLGFGASAGAEELTYDVPAALAIAQSTARMDADFYPFPLVPEASVT